MTAVASQVSTAAAAKSAAKNAPKQIGIFQIDIDVSGGAPRFKITDKGKAKPAQLTEVLIDVATGGTRFLKPLKNPTFGDLSLSVRNGEAGNKGEATIVVIKLSREGGWVFRELGDPFDFKGAATPGAFGRMFRVMDDGTPINGGTSCKNTTVAYFECDGAVLAKQSDYNEYFSIFVHPMTAPTNEPLDPDIRHPGGEEP